MIQCVLDTDSLECNWSKTVLIRSYLENDDPTTFEVIIKSKVPGDDVDDDDDDDNDDDYHREDIEEQ